MVIAEDLRPARGLHPFNANVVFDGDGNAGEWTSIPALLKLLCAPHRALAINLEERV
jgi:hypothetical protein